MTLRYLPFVTNERIVKASKNLPPMRWGETGHAVAILQQALVDYGYTLPRSTKNGVLDGIYGREMHDKIVFFQGQNNLGTDGIAGQNTFACLDLLMTSGTTAKPSKSLTLHFRSLALTAVPFERQFRSAQRMYAQYNIEVRFGSGLSLGLDPTEARKFEQLDGECNWEITTGEFAELQGLGRGIPATDIAVFYISKFSEVGLLGCGGHRPGVPACIVASQASQWDLAHEVGHVLLTSDYPQVHHPSVHNLMYEFSRTNPAVPSLDTRQLAKIRSSPLLH